jgi:hypothetical protein
VTKRCTTAREAGMMSGGGGYPVPEENENVLVQGR